MGTSVSSPFQLRIAAAGAALTVVDLPVITYQRWVAPRGAWSEAIGRQTNALSTKTAVNFVPLRDYSCCILSDDGYLYLRGGAHASGSVYLASDTDRLSVAAMRAGTVACEQLDRPRVPEILSRNPLDGYLGAGGSRNFWYPGYPSANEPAGEGGSGIWGPPNPASSTEWVPFCRHGYGHQGWIPGFGYVEFGYGAVGKNSDSTFQAGVCMNVLNPQSRTWSAVGGSMPSSIHGANPAVTSEWDELNACLLRLGNHAGYGPYVDGLLVSEWTQARGWRNVDKAGGGNFPFCCLSTGNSSAAYYLGGGVHLIWLLEPTPSVYRSWTGSHLNIYHHKRDGTGSVTPVSLPAPVLSVYNANVPAGIAIDKATRTIYLAYMAVNTDPDSADTRARLWKSTLSPNYRPNNDWSEVMYSGTIVQSALGRCGWKWMWFAGGDLLFSQAPRGSDRISFKRLGVS